MPGLPRRTGLAVAVCLALFALPAQAGGNPDEKTKNAAVNKVLKDVINHGADLFNLKNDYAGCYRVYEGALLTVRPFVGHHSDLQKTIDSAIADAGKQLSMIDRAFTLRKAIDRVRERVGIVTGTGSTLWERLGGTINVNLFVEEFVVNALTDPTLNFDRNGKHPIDEKQMQQLVVELISSAAGGPYKYSGRDMKHAHKGMGVTDKEFDRTVSHFKKAMDKHNVLAADVKAMLDIVETTRKDIVEPTAKVTPPKTVPMKIQPPQVDPPKIDPPKLDPPKSEPKKNVERLKELPEIEPGPNQRTFRPDPVPQLLPGNPTPVLPLPGLPVNPQPR